MNATKNIEMIKARRRVDKSSKKAPSVDFKRIWEQAPSSNNTMIKLDPTVYAREAKMPDWKMILSYEDELVREIRLKQQLKLYDVQDVQKELEELTEDEDFAMHTTPEEYEVWKIKRAIKIHIKRYNGNPPKTTVEMYRIGRVLGRGAYGKVNIAAQKLSKKLCAVKSINMSKLRANLTKKQEEKDVIPRIRTEKEILTRLNHPNIVRLYESITYEIKDTRTSYELLFMEICTGGSMLQYLRRRRKLEEGLAKLFMKQLIEALGYLHCENVVHRDIKLENILLSNLGEVKICDFGVSVHNNNLAKERSIKDCCGTPAYMAPEVIDVGEKKKEIALYRKQG